MSSVYSFTSEAADLRLKACAVCPWAGPACLQEAAKRARSCTTKQWDANKALHLDALAG